MVFIETKVSGEQISHQAYQAHLTPLADASEACMVANAQSPFDGQLRAIAEKDNKTTVWFTYYLDKVEKGEQSSSRPIASSLFETVKCGDAPIELRRVPDTICLGVAGSGDNRKAGRTA